jgi:hypothetical protein
MTEHFTFADSVEGLTHAFNLTLSLRRNGFRTRLATRVLDRSLPFTVHTVVATPPQREKTAFERLNASLNRGRRG